MGVMTFVLVGYTHVCKLMNTKCQDMILYSLSPLTHGLLHKWLRGWVSLKYKMLKDDAVVRSRKVLQFELSVGAIHVFF